MRSDQPRHGDNLAGLVAAVVAICCGLPLLLSLGVGAAIGALGLARWGFVVLGPIVVGLGALVVHGGRFRIAAHREGSVDADSHRAR